MPLTESSKAKVSLSSLSATTAAAAENLWSKSKKLSKKRKQSIPDSSVSEISSGNPSTNPLIQSSHSHHQIPTIQHPLGVERHEFRRKFIEGLQFYCEDSSLILNSDLPADLIEFVTANGFSVESLGIILELKKSSSAFSSLVEKKPIPDSSGLGVKAPVDKKAKDKKFSEISRRLLQHWMSADSCAEAFVSLSLGEEIPGLIAECASFQRILFAIPDNFHLNGRDFLSFLLSQLQLAIQALAYGLKDVSQVGAASSDELSPPLKIRSQVLASFFDRIFIRYFSDSEHFYNVTANNPFQNFIIELAKFCSEDTIGKRLVSKIFLHLGAHSASKLVKVILSTSPSELEPHVSPALILLWPAFEFLESNGQWKFIMHSIPCNIVTKSEAFWLSWAEYVQKEGKYLVEIWHKTIDHWIVLNKSSLVDINSLFSTSLAVISLAKQVKVKIAANEDAEKRQELVTNLELGKVLENIVHSLESISEDKRACGMALAQIVTEFNHARFVSEDPTKEKIEKLQFECQSEMFVALIAFYENQRTMNVSEQGRHDSSSRPSVEVLDSDDDEDPNSEEPDHFPDLGGTSEVAEETSVDPRILTLRTRKTKIPMYFSEIVETLLEKSKNEDEQEILQIISVLKIPVLLMTGVRIDSKMAATITRCLADMENVSGQEVPIQLALYELFMKHPFDVADVLAGIAFDKDHYALGHRLVNLTRLTQIALISSKQCCHNCFARVLGKYQSHILGIYPEFIKKYLHTRMTVRVCPDCRKAGVTVVDQTATSFPQEFPGGDASQSLTWRQIVDQRIAAKTRRFITPKSKTVITVPDDFSTRFLPILWSCVANRLTVKARFYMDSAQRQKTGKMNDIFVVKCFQYLARCVMGSSGPLCPHIRNISSHAGELITSFSTYEDAIVRRAVLSLLGVTLTVGEGKVFVIEALSVNGSVIEMVEKLVSVEENSENRTFLSQLQRCLSSYTTLGLLQDLSVDE